MCHLLIKLSVCNCVFHSYTIQNEQIISFNAKLLDTKKYQTDIKDHWSQIYDQNS